MRPWVLPAVYERLRAGRGELLAELRPAIPVFVRFGGIEYDTDDAAAEKLDDFIRRAQRAFADCGGNVLQLTIGDKGAYLYAVFGSPQAHEDDATRAVTAAMRVRALEHTTSVSGIQIGITTGRLLSGTYGHTMRRTFSCLGDAVNLSARLMSNAPPGEVYVTEVVRQRAGELVPVGAARRPAGQGQDEAGEGLDAAWGDDARVATSAALSPRAVRTAQGDGGARGGQGRFARSAGQRRRHRRRGRVGQVPSRRRVHPLGAWQWRAGRLRRVPHVRRLQLRRVVRGVADAARHRRQRAGRRPAGDARVMARRRRRGARLQGAAARTAAQHDDPGLRPDEHARPQAAQGVARGPAGTLPAGPLRRRSARHRARGLPLDRPAVA